MKTDETKRRIRKIKEEIFKKVKDSIMMVEIVKKNFEKTSNTINSPDEPVDAHKNMEKIIRSKKSNILWLVYQQGQIFE